MIFFKASVSESYQNNLSTSWISKSSSQHQKDSVVGITSISDFFKASVSNSFGRVVSVFRTISSPGYFMSKTSNMSAHQHQPISHISWTSPLSDASYSNQNFETRTSIKGIHPTQASSMMQTSSISIPRIVESTCHDCNSNHPRYSDFMFTYKSCLTPIITERFLQTRRKLLDTIIIKGHHFSPRASENVVHFGKFPCNSFHANKGEIQCKMDVSSKPPMNTWLPISLNVKGLGAAIVKIPSQFDRSVLFENEVTSMQPQSGSFGGGTNVIIKGNGLNTSTTVVMIGEKACEN